jgi:phospholipid/cholesterol/gamma-HCH transport system ATP-binding protein
MAVPILVLDDAHGIGEHLPRAALRLELHEGDFAVIEVPGPRRGAAFADMCGGLVKLAGGQVRFLGRDWRAVPDDHADALRGHIGRLFYQPMRADTPDVAARVVLGRMHHTRIPEAELRAEAVRLAVRFGLPGLPAGPARQVAEPILLRAACVRAFLGEPRLVILELPMTAQQDDLVPLLLAAGARARGFGAAVLWLAAPGPALRDRGVRAARRLRLSDAGLAGLRRMQRADDKLPFPGAGPSPSLGLDHEPT